MEIVRQRKKRLLAWILTLVLCVGMWQGNVYATEGDGTVTPITPSETGDATNLPETVATGKSVEISLTYIGSDGYSYVPNFTGTVEYDNWKSNNLSTWSIANSGNTLISEDYTNNELNLTDVMFKNGNHEHKVLNWKYQSPTSDNGKTELKEQTKGTIKLSSVEAEVTDTGNKYSLIAVLGKSVVVSFWETAGSAGTEGYQEYEQVKSDYEKITDNSGDSQWSIETPIPKFKNDENGYFVAGWYVGDDLIRPGDIATGLFDEFEKVITARPSYSNMMQEAGKYSLVCGCAYSYDKENFTIKTGDTAEGYTYTISPGAEFYVREDGEYTFN